MQQLVRSLKYQILYENINAQDPRLRTKIQHVCVNHSLTIQTLWMYKVGVDKHRVS